jgi:transcriptional regulator with XRE-family HTH domain
VAGRISLAVYCEQQIRYAERTLYASRKQPVQNFGQRVRELRRAKNLGQRALAAKVGVSFTYISRVETESLDFGPYPSEQLILKLAKALDADADELLLLAQKIPQPIRQRVLERPDVFRVLAELDDKTLDRLVAEVVAGDRHRGQKPREHWKGRCER